MSKCLLIGCLVFAAFCEVADAQRPLRGNLSVEVDGSSINRRQDVEGSIWEFKVIDRAEKNASKKTKLTGKLRIKQTAVFAVGKIEVTEKEAENRDKVQPGADNRQDANANQRGLRGRLTRRVTAAQGEDTGSTTDDSRIVPGRDSNSVQGELRGLRGERNNRSIGGDVGGERVGDLTKDLSNEKMFRFDEDDKYRLSGVVVVKPDTKRRNGVWIGRYDEFTDGKKKQRWSFELRKIEE
ncbi:MAG: hypothetical protein AAGD11_05310 [Planctomycetota bacterium]